MTIILNGTTGITFPDGQSQDVGVPDPGANGNVLTSNGTVWTSAAAAAQTRISGGTTGLTPSSLTGGDVTLAGTLAIANGGTNNASLGVTAGGVVYSDGSKLVNTGAGTSGYYLQSNGSSAPSWTAVSTTPTTNQVLSATAGASVGAVGTYALLMKPTNDQVTPGSTFAGSQLHWSNVKPVTGYGTTSGTWRAMGIANSWEGGCSPNQGCTVWLRIS